MKANKIFVICLAAAAISCTTTTKEITGIVTATGEGNEITLQTAEGESLTYSLDQAMIVSNPEGILPGMPAAVQIDKKGFKSTAKRVEAPIRSRFCVGTVSDKTADGFDICKKDGSIEHFSAPEGFVLPECDQDTVIVVFYLDEGVAAYAKIRN